MNLKEALQARGLIGGTRLLETPTSPHYKRVHVEKPRRETRPSDLVRIWLDGDKGYPCSQYREWLSLAEEFMAEKRDRYSFKEHKSLLARAFQVWLQNRGY